jgi:hypothetical protein
MDYSFILAIHALLSVRAHFTDSPYWGAWWNESFIGVVLQLGGEHAADDSPYWGMLIQVSGGLSTSVTRVLRAAGKTAVDAKHARANADRAAQWYKKKTAGKRDNAVIGKQDKAHNLAIYTRQFQDSGAYLDDDTPIFNFDDTTIRRKLVDSDNQKTFSVSMCDVHNDTDSVTSFMGDLLN